MKNRKKSESFLEKFDKNQKIKNVKLNIQFLVMSCKSICFARVCVHSVPVLYVLVLVPQLLVKSHQTPEEFGQSVLQHLHRLLQVFCISIKGMTDEIREVSADTME